MSLPGFESRLDFEVREAQMVAMVAPACAHVRYACTPHSPRRGSIGRLRLVTARPAEGKTRAPDSASIKVCVCSDMDFVLVLVNMTGGCGVL